MNGFSEERLPPRVTTKQLDVRRAQQFSGCGFSAAGLHMNLAIVRYSVRDTCKSNFDFPLVHRSDGLVWRHGQIGGKKKTCDVAQIKRGFRVNGLGAPALF
jgi:hypothetical protein